MHRHWLIWIFLLSLLVPACFAQDDNDLPLGDVARNLRRQKDDQDKSNAERKVIDNENLDQLMNQMQSQRFNATSLLFSFDGGGKSFKVSSPDVSCNFSFNANATALLSDPLVPRSVPTEELAKLDGPAVIQGNTLQISVFNGSAWDIKELIVGLTVLRSPAAAPYGPTMKPAAEKVVDLLEKHPDQTVIYHLKGIAAPQSTSVFTADLASELGPDQEWHWAIVGAKGVPANPQPTTNATATSSATLPASVPPAEPALATSSGNPHP